MSSTDLSDPPPQTWTEWVSATLQRIEFKIDILTSFVQQLQQGASEMAADLTALTAQVAATVTVEASIVALCNGLAAQIASLKTDPVALQTLADKLKASAQTVSDAVTANTPPPAPVPTP